MTKNNELLDEIKGIRAQVKELRAQALDKYKTWFSVASKGFFDQFPKLESFSWKQYTDYFNDGETCHFHVHADADYGLSINEVDGDEFYDLKGTDTRGGLTKAEFKEISKVVSEFIDEIGAEYLEEMFGDHVHVVVTANSVETNDYSDHD